MAAASTALAAAFRLCKWVEWCMDAAASLAVCVSCFDHFSLGQTITKKKTTMHWGHLGQHMHAWTN
jgi:hypothetical protein